MVGRAPGEISGDLGSALPLALAWDTVHTQPLRPRPFPQGVQSLKDRQHGCRYLELLQRCGQGSALGPTGSGGLGALGRLEGGSGGWEKACLILLWISHLLSVRRRMLASRLSSTARNLQAG